MIVSRCIVLRMGKSFEESCKEKKKTNIVVSVNFFSRENRSVYKIMRKNVVRTTKGTDDSIIRARAL